MKILVHDYGGYPFPVQLSRVLAERGHEVVHAYATPLPTPSGELKPRTGDPATFRLRGVEMDPEFARYKYSFAHRWRMERSYARRAADLIAQERPQAVLSANTPTEVQQAILRATKAAGGRFLYWMQDFYSVAVDRLLRKKLRAAGACIGMYYRWLEGRQLRASDCVVAITEDFVPIMVHQFRVNPAKIAVIPNWAPIEELPVGTKTNAWSLEHDLVDKFVFLYAGTLGMKHNPGMLLDLARHFRTDEAVRVMVISEGLGGDWLRKEALGNDVQNLILSGYQPMSMMPDVLASGDVLVALLEEDAGVFSVPSKVAAYLCAERPILLAAPQPNLATRIVAAEAAGLTVPPGDTAAFLDAAGRLRQNLADAAAMGRRGRAYAERTFKIEDIARQFEELAAR